MSYRCRDQHTNYYGIQTFKWSEREFSIQELVEDYSQYLPFIFMVTEGYSSSRLEIADGEVYWLYEVTTQPCLVCRDHRGQYFSIPDCYQHRVVPLKEEKPDYFVSARKSMTLDEFRKQDRWRYFRFLGTYTKEVFDGADEGKMMKIGRLEIVDTFEEKLLVGHPVLGQPYVEMRTDIRRIMEETYTGAIYPVVTLIPVYIPIMTTIAVCMNGKSDHKFFKAMLELKQFASLCKHDYSKDLEEDAEIMLFKKPPVDNVYDYIQMVPLLKEPRESMASQSDGTAENDSSDSDYEVIDPIPDKIPEARSLSHRYEPIAYANEMDPIERLQMLKKVYETGTLPPDTDPVEEPPPPAPPEERPPPSSPGPPVPKRGTRIQRRQPPPPLPKPAKPVQDSKPPVPGASKHRSPDADLEQWELPKTSTSVNRKPSSTAESAVQRPSPKLEQQKQYNRSPGTEGGLSKEISVKLAAKKASSVDCQEIGVKLSTSKPQNKDRVTSASKDKQPTRSEYSLSRGVQQERIENLEDIPSDISELSVYKLTDCLRLLNMEEHVPAFERSLVDGELLCSLTEDLLVENFNFSKFDANKLIRFSKGWRPKLQ